MQPDIDETPAPQRPRRRLSDAELGHLFRVRWRHPDRPGERETIFGRRGAALKFAYGRLDEGCAVTIDRAPKPAEFADQPSARDDVESGPS